jgi:hypothetical protein
MILAGLLSAHAADRQIYFHDDFNSLDQWEPLHFPSVEAHTRYEILTDGSNKLLRAHSVASASAIVRTGPYDVYQYPRVRWRWKVDRVLEKGDATRKDADDYAIRVYVMFVYEPKRAKRSKRIKYGIAKKLLGEYPPDSTLNYFWANRPHKERILTNPYAKEARMVTLRTGSGETGQWLEESVNVIDDYREAFGTAPPTNAIIAIMSDTDNTGESATAYVDWLEVSR